MDQLKHHGLSVLKEKLDKNMIQSRNAASAVQLAIGEDSATVPERSASASGVLDGFALGMDIYFTKDGQEVKKGLESKLAKKLFKLAEQFDLGLTELKKMKDVFSQDRFGYPRRVGQMATPSPTICMTMTICKPPLTAMSSS
ncbi:uncharacterized protein V3H82_000432 [Fundulus diaphanus]